jgi:carbonic anhydrase
VPAAFSYDGATGPEKWGSLDPSYAACSTGREQSPIDLRDGSPAREPALEVSYVPADDPEAVNNGHSVQVPYPKGSSITLDGTEYGLVEFHFHAPSEHEIEGSSYPLELHFVNADAEGDLAVLGVMVAEGAEHPAFTALVGAMPTREGERTQTKGALNAGRMLPADPGSVERWSYDGSLTTPPCTEGVRWTVFNEPIEMSKEQIAAFTAAYDHNNRPLQPLNGRELRLVTP